MADAVLLLCLLWCDQGFLHARGRFLVFLDTDHWFEKEVIGRVLNIAATLPVERVFYSTFSRLDSRVGKDPAVGSGFTHLKGSKRQEWIDTYMQGSPNSMIISRKVNAVVGLRLRQAGSVSVDGFCSWLILEVAAVSGSGRLRRRFLRSLWLQRQHFPVLSAAQVQPPEVDVQLERRQGCVGDV